MQDNEEVKGYARKYQREISALLRRVPRELLLLLKTNDCLRSIDADLGRPLNAISITARACARALSEHRTTEASEAGLRGATAAARYASRAPCPMLHLHPLRTDGGFLIGNVFARRTCASVMGWSTRMFAMHSEGDCRVRDAFLRADADGGTPTDLYTSAACVFEARMHACRGHSPSVRASALHDIIYLAEMLQ